MFQKSVKMPKWPLSVAEFRKLLEKLPQDAMVKDVKMTLEAKRKRK